MKILVLLFTILSLSALAKHDIAKSSFVKNTGSHSESFQSITFNGSWCWFSDPRAVYYEGEHKRTYTGWVDNYGDITVAFYDHETGEIESKVIADNFEIDDHDESTCQGL